MSPRYISMLALILMLLSIVSYLPIAIGETTAKYKWTIMVYVDGDNNLEGAGIDDINEMELAGSTNEVAIIVLFDRCPGYDTSNGDWTGARIYKILKDTDMSLIRSELLLDLGEVNMGDPETVLFFVNYTVKHFPAEHYTLIFWDHGNAWRSKQEGMSIKGVCWDWTNNNDYLTQQELRYIFEKLQSTGIHIDIVGFDACLMQMIEVAYDFIGYADIVVASEEYEPLDGWAYDGFLIPLVTNPDMTPQELASTIVKAYGDFYTNVGLTWTTLSALDLGKLSNVVNALNKMARALTYEVYFYPKNATTIQSLRDKSEKFCEGEFIDLWHFAELINSTPGFVYDPRPFASELILTLNETVISSYAGSNHPNAHGLAIYFPPTVDWYLEERYWYFLQTQLPLQTWWGWFLDFYFRTMTPTEHLWLKVVTSPIITPGKVVTAFVLIGFGKSKILADYLNVYLVHPNGSKTSLEAIGIEPGLYMVSFTIPEDYKYDTCSILVDAYYWFLSLSDISALTISKELALIPSIEENVSNITKELGGVAKGLENITTSIDDLIKMMKALEPVIIEVKYNTVKLLTRLGTMDAKLDAIKDLKNENFYKFKLYVLGDYKGSPFLNYIKKYSLNDVIVLKGYVKNIFEFLKDMDIFVYPTLYDACPLIVFEAMASGLACVVSSPKYCGASEIIEDNKTGLFIYNPHDPKEIKDKLKILMDDINFLKQISQNSYEKIKSYTWEKIGSRYEEVFNSIVNFHF